MNVTIFCLLCWLAVSVSGNHDPGTFGGDEHYKDGEHNPDYDHNAFIGKEEARRLEDLSPEESKAELGKIFEKIDVNKDGSVSEAELKEWIEKIQHRYIKTDTDRQWRDYGITEKGHLDFSTFMKKTYGYDSEADLPKDGFDYASMLQRDKRRWKAADVDGDGVLSRTEFEAFLHPEEFTHMHDIVVEETLEDIDKNKDGVVSLDEYIGDMWPDRERDPNAAEPDWVQSEREAFARYRDANGDGVLDRTELRKWFLPSDYDHAAAEARHLINEADTDRDGLLSQAEMLDKHDVFIGSQALDFGEALKYHDEL